jgi:hypothetical protein
VDFRDTFESFPDFLPAKTQRPTATALEKAHRQERSNIYLPLDLNSELFQRFSKLASLSSLGIQKDSFEPIFLGFSLRGSLKNFIPRANGAAMVKLINLIFSLVGV